MDHKAAQRKARHPECEICGQEKEVSKSSTVANCLPCRRFLKKWEKTQTQDTCPFDGDCEVTEENRNDCPPCRYNKYLKLKMEREDTNPSTTSTQPMSIAVLDFSQEIEVTEETCELCEQISQKGTFKHFNFLLMCGRCRILVTQFEKKEANNPLVLCQREDGSCIDFPDLASCSVCLFEKYKDLLTKPRRERAPVVRKSRPVMMTLSQNQTPEVVIPPTIDLTTPPSSVSSAPISMAPEPLTPCKICGDGVREIGADACGACVDFYTRKLTSRHHQECKNGKKCKITVKTRNSCPTCRFEKCKMLGMVSKDSANDLREEIENLPPACSSVSDTQRKRHADTMLQDIANQSANQENMDMCKLCKKEPDQYPHQLYQGISVCHRCTDLIKLNDPAQKASLKCQGGHGDCRINFWVVDCWSCILKEYDELMETQVAEQAMSNRSRSNMTDNEAFDDFNSPNIKRTRMQSPVLSSQVQEECQEDPLDDLELFDDLESHYSLGLGAYPIPETPRPSENLNLELQDDDQHEDHTWDLRLDGVMSPCSDRMENQDQNQVDPGMYQYNQDPEPVRIDNGQKEITGANLKTAVRFRINRGDCSKKKPRKQAPIRQDQQQHQNPPHVPQLFHDQQQNQNYPNISDHMNLGYQTSSHDNVYSNQDPSTSSNMEYQNYRHVNDYSNQPTGKVTPGIRQNLSTNSDPEVALIDDDEITEVYSNVRMHQPTNSKALPNVYAQGYHNTSSSQNQGRASYVGRSLVRPSEKPVILPNSGSRAYNPSEVSQNANGNIHYPTKTSTAPQALTRRPACAPTKPIRPGVVLQQHNNNVMQNGLFRPPQRPSAPYKMYNQQDMTMQPTASVLVDQSYGIEPNGNAGRASVVENRAVRNNPNQIYASEPMINQPSTSRAPDYPPFPQISISDIDFLPTDSSSSLESYSNVALNGIHIGYVQGYSEQQQQPPLTDMTNTLSSSTPINPPPQLGNATVNGQNSNNQNGEAEPVMYQWKPRNPSPEKEDTEAIKTSPPASSDAAHQQENEELEDDEFGIGTHEDDFDPDMFERLLDEDTEIDG